MSTFQYADQIIEGDWRGTRNPVVCGVRLPAYPNHIHANFESDLPTFRTRKEDVYVVTYPKSGELYIMRLIFLMKGYLGFVYRATKSETANRVTLIPGDIGK